MKNNVGVPIPKKPQKNNLGFFDGFPSEFYHGVLFRSKLEVEWARYLDSFGIEWKYEPEYFNIGHGRRYTPDFKIYEKYFEVKPSVEQISLSFDKFKAFVDFGYQLFFLVGYEEAREIFQLRSKDYRFCLEELTISEIIQMKEDDKVMAKVGQSRITKGGE